jgi:hypothetical protein
MVLRAKNVHGVDKPLVVGCPKSTANFGFRHLFCKESEWQTRVFKSLPVYW